MDNTNPKALIRFSFAIEMTLADKNKGLSLLGTLLGQVIDSWF